MNLTYFTINLTSSEFLGSRIMQSFFFIFKFYVVFGCSFVFIGYANVTYSFHAAGLCMYEFCVSVMCLLHSICMCL